jgi:hypothetical protein
MPSAVPPSDLKGIHTLTAAHAHATAAVDEKVDFMEIATNRFRTTANRLALKSRAGPNPVPGTGESMVD